MRKGKSSEDGFGRKVENKMKSSKISSFPLDKILICLIHTHGMLPLSGRVPFLGENNHAWQ
jgi:hypothetical protein